jgi:hypothetical protein
MLPVDAYMREALRICDKPVFLQNWRDLLFLHFSLDPGALRSVVPSDLELDTFPNEDGIEQAWVGLVPFRMQDVRPRILPAIPTTKAFPETNVRTYVHRNGRPGVWFFSLDAASRLACIGGRNLFHLPYKEAKMSVTRNAEAVRYFSKRSTGIGTDIEAVVSGDSRTTEPKTLEFFLVERYLLFSTNGRAWYGGNVHHAPYKVRQAELQQCTETLVRASGINSQPFTHTMFVDAVDVRIGVLEKLE